MKKIFTLLFLSAALFTHEVHIWDASSYNQNSISQQKTSQYLLEKFKFDGDEAVLDLGCGEGKLSAAISSLIPSGEITGIDLSSNMIDFAKESFPHHQFPNLSFNEGNACYLDYKDAFDVIFSFTALQWVEDHEKALKCMKRALKPNGTIAVAMPMGFPLTMNLAIEEMISDETWRPFFTDFSTGFNFVTLEKYETLLEMAGFDINLIEKMPQKDFFESKEALSSFMSQWFPYLRALPDDLKETFMSQFLDRYFELEEIDIANGEPVYFYPTHLIVIAHKK